MPKNKQGGKNFKKQKNKTDESHDKPINEKTEGQEYASVTKLLGNSKVYAIFYDIKLKQEREIMCILRPGLKKKRQFAKMESTILISLRDFENNKADVIYVYNDDEVHRMKRKKILSDNMLVKEKQGDFEFIDNYNSDEEEEKEKEKEKEKKYKTNEIKKKNNITIQDLGLPNFSDEEEEIDNI
tara:strand:+ start:4295 stop:4846 length:552 start_codon:yes stop_codon:yes gene_type:complete